jgi:alpha-tubulin suppressor-like RCC1 family protein
VRVIGAIDPKTESPEEDYLSDIVDLSFSVSHALAVKSDGRVYTWGKNGYGVMGTGSASNDGSSRPVRVLAPGEDPDDPAREYLTGVTAVACGVYHSFAIKTDGTLLTWGYNESGQLGIGDDTVSEVRTPVQVVKGASPEEEGEEYLTGIIAISGGGGYINEPWSVYAHSLALKSDGTVWSWGNNDNNRLGCGIAGHQNAPVQVLQGNGPGVDGKLNLFGPPVLKGAVLKDFGYAEIPVSGALVKVVDEEPAEPVTVANVLTGRDGSFTIDDLTVGKTYRVYVYAQGCKPDYKDVKLKPAHPVERLKLDEFIDVSVGESFHAVALDVNKQVWSWGNNTNGQIGNGGIATGDVLVPSEVVRYDTDGGGNYIKLNDAIIVEAGIGCNLAVRSNGSVWSWGSNQYRKIGHSSTGNYPRATPIQAGTPTPIPEVIALTTGDDHTMALDKNGEVWLWGRHNYNELGVSGSTDGIPSKIAKSYFEDKKIIQILAIEQHNIVLAEDGKVWGWGRNQYGELGSEGQLAIGAVAQGSTHAPVKVQKEKTGGGYEDLTDIIYIGQTHYIKFAIDSNFDVWAWGRTDRNALPGSDGSTTNQNFAKNVTNLIQLFGDNEMYFYFEGGGYYLNSLRTDLKVYSWGRNNNGGYANNTTTHEAVNWPPTQTPVIAQEKFTGTTKLLENIYSLTSINGQAAAIDTSGNVWTWMLNTNGALGINETGGDFPVASYAVQVFNPYTLTPGFNLLSPPEPPPAMGSVSGTVTVKDMTVGVEGVKVTVGDDPDDPAAPHAYTNANGEYTITNVPVGTDIKITAFAWGYVPDEDEVTVEEDIETTDTDFELDVFMSVSVGAEHTVALDRHGYVWAWGRGDYGRLGQSNIDLNDKTTPVRVLKGDQVVAGESTYLTNIVAISAAGNRTMVSTTHKESAHTLALCKDGYVWSWGAAGYGRLGQGTSGVHDIVAAPKRVLRGEQRVDGENTYLKNIVKISAGLYSSLAIEAGTGYVYCFGNNYYGVVGDGTNNDRHEPVFVVRGNQPIEPNPLGLDTAKLRYIVSASVGAEHVIAVDSQGRVFTWGYNNNGSLAISANQSQNTPQYPTGNIRNEVIKSVSAGFFFIAALDSNGKIWTAGASGNGQLGRSVGGQGDSNLVQVTNVNITGIVAVSCGYRHLIVLRQDGSIWSAGSNNKGQLGDNSITSPSAGTWVRARKSPGGVTDLLDKMVALPEKQGFEYTAAVSMDGTVMTWGDNTYGQLGRTVTGTDNRIPIGVATPNLRTVSTP